MKRALRLWPMVLVVALAACEPAPPLADGTDDDATVTCSTCHGSADNAAPPAAINPDLTTADLGVGAHQAHLVDGSIRHAVACDECHIVPETVEEEGHVDPLPAEIHFGPLSQTGDLVPMWDREEASCSATYCHGSGLAGGEDVAPIWTRVDGTQARCESCHGSPPPLPHPPATDCERCHSDTVGPFNNIRTELRQHIDGDVDVDLLACGACHGGGLTPAPPASVSGETSTTARGVGAHRSHIFASANHGPVACVECHVVPERYGDEGHVDDALPAELVWGPTATARGASPVFEELTCSNTHCHGGTMLNGGGTLTTPRWTTVDGTQAACGTCHATPPSLPHPPNPDCASCHSEVMASATEFADPTLHVDGVVQIDGVGCAACHGSGDNAAPPRDTFGNTERSFVGVGAHATHTGDAVRWAPIGCDACHLVPATVDSPGHADTAAPAELVWGEIATRDNVIPLFDGLNCTVYCHGASLNAGGTLTTPAWTATDSQQAYCGSCHGVPPPPPHPAATLVTCSGCHPTMGALPDPARHVNGVVDFGQ